MGVGLGIATAMGLSRIIYSAGGAARTTYLPARQVFAKGLTSPLFQGGGFGVGYTSGAYGGYGISNTLDPLGVHKPKYSRKQGSLGLPYGSYGRRRYSRGYSGYSRYSRRSYYRRRRPYYRRSQRYY